MNRVFIKKDVQMAPSHMKSCLNSPVMSEMQINTNEILLPTKMAKIKKNGNTKSWERCGA